MAELDIEFTIDPNDIKLRDELLMKIIAGATKAGIHVDKRKEYNRNRCRKSKHRDREEY